MELAMYVQFNSEVAHIGSFSGTIDNISVYYWNRLGE